jgi:hypothetical protein
MLFQPNSFYKPWLKVMGYGMLSFESNVNKTPSFHRQNHAMHA